MYDFEKFKQPGFKVKFASALKNMPKGYFIELDDIFVDLDDVEEFDFVFKYKGSGQIKSFQMFANAFAEAIDSPPSHVPISYFF